MQVLLALFRPQNLFRPQKNSFFLLTYDLDFWQKRSWDRFCQGLAKQTPIMNGRKMSSPGRNQEGQNNERKKGKLSL
jgi:hypothetical protein